MSESQWQKQGATLSHKNASEEFCLTEAEVIEAMKAGKVQYRQNVALGILILDSFELKLSH